MSHTEVNHGDVLIVETLLENEINLLKKQYREAGEEFCVDYCIIEASQNITPFLEFSYGDSEYSEMLIQTVVNNALLKLADSRKS